MYLQIIKGEASAKYRKNLIAQTVAAALAVTSFASYSAEQADVEKDDIDDVIVVTAQKRVQNVMKVPVTVDTVSAETIKESGSILLSDIDKFIPGFEFSDSSMTQAGVTIRGISSPSITVGGDPSSATFFDNVYMPRAAQNVLFSDMQRVEVLKGPQGTLFGKNAAMGVVNLVPNAPHADFESFIKGTLGTDNLQRIEGMVNFSLADNVYLRANFLTNTQDGFIDNLSRPEWNDDFKTWDNGAKDHTAARIAVKWEISDNTNMQVSYDFDDLEQAPKQAVGLSEWAYAGGQDPFAGKVENDVREGVETRDMSAVTFKLNHQFTDAWSMMFVSSYREWDTVNREDEDGTADASRYLDTSNNEDSDIFYNELQVNYNTDKLNFVGGLTYSKENVKQTTEVNTTAATAARLVTDVLKDKIKYGDESLEIIGINDQLAAVIGGDTDEHAEAAFGPGVTFDDAVNLTFTQMGLDIDHIWNADEWSHMLNVVGGDLGLPSVSPEEVLATGDLTYNMAAELLGLRQIFGPNLVGGSFGPNIAAGMFSSENVNNTGEFTSIGIYGDVDYKITDKWNVFAGLRYSEDEKEFSWEVTPTTLTSVYPSIDNFIFDAYTKTSTSKTWDKVTGRIGTGYQITDDHMVFATYSTGYKAGGYDSLSPPATDPNTGKIYDTSFDPEETANFEFGYKGVLFDSLRTMLAIYHTELDGRQRSVNTNPPDDGSDFAVPGVVNEDITIDGIELGLQWQISDSLTTGVVTDYRENDIESADFWNSAGELIESTKISDESNTSYTLTLDWMPDLGLGNTKLHIDYVFVENARNLEIGNAEWMNDIPGYFDDTENLNARISWASEDDHLEVGIWSKNILDNQYIGGAGGLSADVLGTPITSITRGMESGIDVKYSF